MNGLVTATMTNNRPSALVLHRAAWVVPVAGPPVADGAVLTEGGTIVAVGPMQDLRSATPAEAHLIDHGEAALMPALVNAHTHLELTSLAGRIPLPQASFASWLKTLLPVRSTLTDEAVDAGIAEGLQLLTAAGCILCGDVSNTGRATPAGMKLSNGGDGNISKDRHGDAEMGRRGEKQPVRGELLPPRLPLTASPLHRVSPSPQPHTLLPARHLFRELLGFNVDSLEKALGDSGFERLQESSPEHSLFSLAAHAPYSTSAALIRETKDWCRKHGRPFSIHAAEHPEESRFLTDGTGFCRDLLQSLGRWMPSWTPPGESPIRYLHRLGVLDTDTLLVHAVHLTASDWDTVAAAGCTVCFCPRSNHFLGVGKPAPSEALRRNIPTALGTDSLAGNTDLNLFAEAAFVLDRYADVSPEEILAMITLGGAQALGQSRLYGSIDSGKRADLLAVTLPASFPFSSSVSQLAETLIRQGKEGAWRWAHRSHMV